MSLDVYLRGANCEHCGRGGETLYESNITHNLGPMADAAGIYKHLWRPDEIGIETARYLIEPLRSGLRWLMTNEAEARKHDAPNGWGVYPDFVSFVTGYLLACEKNPSALVEVSR